MKIEIGESLIYSWLRHVKQCQIVQMNWKLSPRWQAEIVDLEPIKIDIENEFKDTALDIFQKNNSISQLLQQAEIDVVGFSLDSVKDERIYHFVDVAFHENGLNYGSKEKTISRVLKKFIRSYFLYLSYFNDNSPAVFYFITPKMSKQTLFIPLQENIERVNKVFNQHELNPDFQIVTNEEFNSSILIPTMGITGEIADTNELFLRSVQLWKMFENEPREYHINPLGNSPQAIKLSIEDKNVGKKIGQHVQDCMMDLIEKNQIDEIMIEKLLSQAYCKKQFNTNFPLLRKINQGKLDKRRYKRYYKKYWKIGNDLYYFSSQWYEKQRQSFDHWYHQVLENN